MTFKTKVERSNVALLGIDAKSTTPPLLLEPEKAPKKAKKAPKTEADTPKIDYFGDLKPAKERITYAASALESRIERFSLQSVAREIIPKARTANCLRARLSGTTAVGVKYSKAAQRASYSNLQTCASVWACPCCSSKISEHRRDDLVTLVEAHKATGGVVLLVTRTFPHSLMDKLSELLKQLAQAETKYKSGKPWQRLTARFGFVGTVRAVEATYGANGWHPHIHELVFLSGPVDERELEAQLFARWRSAAKRAGFDAPSKKHGLDVRDGSQAAKYASKWGLESELTKWQTKKGHEFSFSPFDLLRVAFSDESPAAVTAAQKLFYEYATHFKGKRQLVYSKGLRRLYELPEELSDEEAAVGVEPDAVILGQLTPYQWRAILQAGKRAHLLEAINAAGGEWSAIEEVLGTALEDFTIYELCNVWADVLIKRLLLTTKKVKRNKSAKSLDPLEAPGRWDHLGIGYQVGVVAGLHAVAPATVAPVAVVVPVEVVSTFYKSEAARLDTWFFKRTPEQEALRSGVAVDFDNNAPARELANSRRDCRNAYRRLCLSAVALSL
jgi:hypothetical protein